MTTTLRTQKKLIPIKKKLDDVLPVAAYPMLVHKLREIVNNLQGGTSWLQNISDEHLLELYDFAKKDMPPEVVLKHARSVWNYPVIVTNKSHKASIQLFKNQALRSPTTMPVKSPKEAEVRKGFMSKVNKLMGELDVVEELIYVAREQKRRVQSLLDDEVVEDKIHSYNTGELITYNNMLHSLIDKLQRLGLLDEKPVEHVLQMNGTFASVVNFISKTGGQDRMLGIANDFLSNISKDILEMEMDKDGNFIIPEQKDSQDG